MTGTNHYNESRHDPTGGTQTEFLLVKEDDHLWACPTEMVEKVFYLDEITRIPLMPPAVVGLANVGGEVIPVANLTSLDGGPAATWRPRGNRCVLLSVNQYRLAIMVERIRQIVRIPDGQRHPLDDEIFSHRFSWEDEDVYQLDCEKLVRVIRNAVRGKLKEAGFLPEM